MTPFFSSGFSKTGSQNVPPSPLQFPIFCHTPPANIIIPCANQKQVIFSARYQILILTVFLFFPKNLVDTMTDTSPESTQCENQI